MFLQSLCLYFNTSNRYNIMLNCHRIEKLALVTLEDGLICCSVNNLDFWAAYYFSNGYSALIILR